MESKEDQKPLTFHVLDTSFACLFIQFDKNAYITLEQQLKDAWKVVFIYHTEHFSTFGGNFTILYLTNCDLCDILLSTHILLQENLVK